MTVDPALLLGPAGLLIGCLLVIYAAVREPPGWVSGRESRRRETEIRHECERRIAELEAQRQRERAQALETIGEWKDTAARWEQAALNLTPLADVFAKILEAQETRRKGGNR